MKSGSCYNIKGYTDAELAAKYRNDEMSVVAQKRVEKRIIEAVFEYQNSQKQKTIDILMSIANNAQSSNSERVEACKTITELLKQKECPSSNTLI